MSLLCSLIAALAGPHLSGVPLAQAGAETAGYSDFSYKYAGVTTPTADKPQSKLWFNDGIWWASMFNNTSTPRAYHIYRLNLATQTWIDTGVEIDERSSSQGDFLWNSDTGKLYVVSGSPLVDGRFLRYGYDPSLKKYTREVGPIVVRKGGGESISLDRDSTGRLWVTFTQNSQVYVNHSLGSDSTWSTPFVIPGARALDADDISAVVAYRDSAGGRIGVLWSNHVSTAAMYFAYHRDSDAPNTWQPIETIYSGKCLADDHISIKSLQADPSGSLFAAVKTSLSDSGCGGTGSSPLIRLVVRKPTGAWTTATFGTATDQHTRPIVLLDTTNRKVYMFATAPTSCGVIYMKSTSMDAPSFPSGAGTPFIKSNTFNCINNATSTKQTLDANSGLVVLAADESQGWYLHNTLSLGTPQPRLAFARQPAGAEIGRTFTTQPIVAALTSQGQINTAYNGPVTLAIKSGTGTAGATLAGTATRNAVNGVANFSDLAINVAGNGYQISASAAGYLGAASFLFDVTKISQTIAVAPIPVKRYGDPPVSVEAVAYVSGTSQPTGLPVSYVDVSANDACQVSNGEVQIVGVGTCTVRASQSGNSTYAPAIADESFTVQKAVQSISFQLPIKHYGDPPFAISATASSGLAVSFSASGACKVKGNIVTITARDFCTILASQAGNTYYFAAPTVSQSISPYYNVYLPLSR